MASNDLSSLRLAPRCPEVCANRRCSRYGTAGVMEPICIYFADGGGNTPLDELRADRDGLRAGVADVRSARYGKAAT